MEHIAVIITAFNRKEKTLACLQRLFGQDHRGTSITVFLTDDGSTDGTTEAVSEQFPQVVLSHGDGTLFWGGGMNLSWKRAVAQGGFDGYLWLNDDTLLLDNVWDELQAADAYSREKYGKGGIYIGSTTDLKGMRHTYGGSVVTSKWRSRYRPLMPDGSFQEADIANGNVTYVSADVVGKIGCFYPGYIHGADYDYTFWARKEGFPLLVLPHYCGRCDYDHKSLKQSLEGKSLAERINYLYAPNGMQLPTALLFQKRFYPWYVPVCFVSYWLKALFPWLMKE